jgi:hypothetical protein
MSIYINRYTGIKHAVETLLVYSVIYTIYYSGKVLHSASPLILFSIKGEEEIDETCFMQIFWELNVLGNAIPNILTTKQ